MSLPTDIIQLIGPKGVPVVVFGSVLGVFELGERLASQRAKDALSKWLLTFDIQRAKALPDGTQEIFERIFGERHFSLKCFVRSAAFSLGAMVFLGVLVFLIDPKSGSLVIGAISYSYLVALTLWLMWSILVDYISLFKTRLILGVLARMHRRTKMVAVIILGIDYMIYRLLFVLGFALVGGVNVVVFGGGKNWGLLLEWVGMVFDIRDAWGTMFHVPYVERDPLLFVLFWAGFAPSIWMWLYVFALFVTRALLRSEKLVNRLRWFLDVEKTPFRSIGAVAAALAFIVSVAIILVSAEVSRISAAS